MTHFPGFQKEIGLQRPLIQREIGGRMRGGAGRGGGEEEKGGGRKVGEGNRRMLLFGNT